MNTKLIEMIVHGRQESGLKQSDVGKMLGVKGNTISDWERGRTEPDIDSFIRLCRIYHINAAEALNDVYGLNDNDDFLLAKSEILHIKKYRTLDEHGRGTVDIILDREHARCTTHPTPAPLELREERAEYNVIHISHPDNRASAGFGDDLDSDNVTTIKAIANRNTIRADFCVTVDGHSMEPLYHDGDIVLVHRQPAVDVGEIGIFVMNDKGFIKKQGEDSLISINHDYPNVEPEECYEYKCFGEVIGVLEPEWIVG